MNMLVTALTLLATITASPTATSTEASTTSPLFAVRPIFTAGDASCNVPALLVERIASLPTEIPKMLKEATNLTEDAREILERFTDISTYVEVGELVDAITKLPSGDLSGIESVICWGLVSE